MNFIEKILTALKNFGTMIFYWFGELFDFLAKPLSYILEFFIGVFYFIGQMLLVLVEFVKLFVALFQFLFSLVTGLIRTITSWVGFTPSTAYQFPSSSRQGFEAVLENVGGTGLLHAVPMILIAFIWLFFVVKVISLFGGKGESTK